MNRLERMFKSGQLPSPKDAQKPNNNNHPLRDHNSIFTISNNPKYDWDPLGYKHSINEPKHKVYLSAQWLEVCCLWESDEEDGYEA